MAVGIRLTAAVAAAAAAAAAAISGEGRHHSTMCPVS